MVRHGFGCEKWWMLCAHIRTLTLLTLWYRLIVHKLAWCVPSRSRYSLECNSITHIRLYKSSPPRSPPPFSTNSIRYINKMCVAFKQYILYSAVVCCPSLCKYRKWHLIFMMEWRKKTPAYVSYCMSIAGKVNDRDDDDDKIVCVCVCVFLFARLRCQNSNSRNKNNRFVHVVVVCADNKAHFVLNG